uniref:Protein tolA n=1 Tax=Hirondellea gigas TaxID=1518452 RepID=A0A6A7G3W5_9CRUS
MASDMDKFKALNAKPYAEQAKWFLNAFWDDCGEANTADIWTYTNSMIEIDEQNGKSGCELEELTAHRFLEQRGDTLTVREMREVLKKIDIDSNKRMSLCEYLIYRYKASDPDALHDLVNALQGDKEMIDKAQALLDDALAAMSEAQREAQEAREADDKAQTAKQAAEQAEAEAVAAEDHCRELERPLKEAEEEVRKAQAELKAQEDAYTTKKTTLEKKSEEGGLVSRNKAKNELQQLLSEDPLPLRRAQTTTDAALRKAEKVRAPFKAAREAAEAVRADAVTMREASDVAAAHAAQQRADAEASLAKAAAAFQEAEDFLELAKKSVPKGSIWWMEREIAEAKRFLPQSRGGGR